MISKRSVRSKRHSGLFWLWAVSTPVACAGGQTHSDPTSAALERLEQLDTANVTAQKRQVQALLKSIETGDRTPAAVIDANNYTQHDLNVADGLAGFRASLTQLPKDSTKVETVRVFQDGDIVFAHTDYNLLGPKIGFDVFRFENGKIVEHWSNLQDKPARPNASGHTMTDGPTQCSEHEKTAANKALVRSFVQDVLIDGKLETLRGFYDQDNYVQHDPHVADGVTGLTKALQAQTKQGIGPKYEKLHHLYGEGNFVLAVSEGWVGDQHVAFYDMYRIKNGKLAEHWDTRELIPARDHWKNQNGKF
jgi:predicted SnoaL-like aldol condensation-catalyzing enzyme